MYNGSATYIYVYILQKEGNIVVLKTALMCVYKNIVNMLHGALLCWPLWVYVLSYVY